ncbi:MAG TPA: D-Ala-D-Ala carboxypeptidase family metallohydrolase [Enhygromyxa sp.]|nr:D-Ala-D-Ala carboxypeptidase family metallohydrolase [Enhygromyxa sp.]
MREAASRAVLCLILAAPTGVVLACAEGTGAEDGGLVCDPGEGMMCECESGLTSVAWCRHDGAGYLPCECEAGDEGFGEETGAPGDGDGDGDGDGESGDGDGESGDGDGEPGDGDGDGEPGDGDGEPGDGDGDGDGEPGDGDGEPVFDQACYLGPAKDNSVCFPIATPNPLPTAYDYPAPYQGNANYRSPIRYLDLETIDLTTAVAPNFTLDELAQLYKGRYAVVQPHAVERLQDLRDVLGPLVVNSGYRSPGYNAQIGGATSSRHMYGDGFDLDPVDVSLATLEAACTQNAGFLVEYETHVHCDWRSTAVDVGFYGLPDIFDPQLDYPVLAAELERDPITGHWLAPASGFDEGEPQRRWFAFDADDRLIAEARGRTFAAPSEAVRVEVIVGAQIHLRSAE